MWIYLDKATIRAQNDSLFVWQKVSGCAERLATTHPVASLPWDKDSGLEDVGAQVKVAIKARICCTKAGLNAYIWRQWLKIHGDCVPTEHPMAAHRKQLDVPHGVEERVPMRVHWEPWTS